jgi:hypothetical protein
VIPGTEFIPGTNLRCTYCLRDISRAGQALAQFVDYAISLPDVYFITHSDLIRWMQVHRRAGGACVV